MALSNCVFVDCNGVVPNLYTNVLLTPALNSLSVGVSVVKLAEYPDTCFRVTKIAPSSPALPFTITNVYGDSNQVVNCATCVASFILYILEDCLEIADPIYSFTDLASVVGKVVKLEGDANRCRSVSVVVYGEQDTQTVVILTNNAGVPQIFDDCICCLPPVLPAPVKYTRVIPKPDRHFYQIRQGQCDINANIRFADGYYRLFKQLKYGIDSQCDNVNLERLWIRKNLSDLAMINDPTACIITTPVKPVVCPEPSGHPFIPPIPPPTYSFTIGAGGIPSGLFNCTQCFDGSNPGLYGSCPSFNITLDYNILDTIEPSSIYVFSYNGGCIFVDGASIQAGYDPSFETYTLTASNITNTGVGAPDPCTSCGG